MAKINLAANQAAVILTADEGDIEVDIAYDGDEGLAGRICKALAMKLLGDEAFRDDILAMVADGSDDT
jgi:hypothetical protein